MNQSNNTDFGLWRLRESFKYATGKMKGSGGLGYNILTWNTVMDNKQTYLQYKQKNITEQEVAEKKQSKIVLFDYGD